MGKRETLMTRDNTPESTFEQSDPKGSLFGHDHSPVETDPKAKTFQPSAEESSIVGWQAMQRLADLYTKQKNYRAAALVYRRLLGHEPQSSDVRNRLALSLMMAGELEPALEEMQKALESAPGGVMLMVNLGKMQMVAEKWSAAQETLHLALEMAEGPIKAEIEQTINQCAKMEAQSRSRKRVEKERPIKAEPVLAKERFNVLFVQDLPCIRNYKECKALKSRGHGVALAYVQGPISQIYQLSDDVYDKCLQLKNPQELWELSKRFDLVHCHNEPDHWTVAAIAGEKPVVHDTHDMISLRQPEDPNIAFLEAVANRGAQGRVYVSDYLLQTALERYSVDPATSLVLPNYVDREMAPQASLPKLSADDGQVHLVYEGGLTHEPGTHRSFMPFFIELAQAGLQVHIHPAFANPLVQQAASQNPNLHYYPPAPPDKLLEVLTRYDYGLVPFVIQPHNRMHLDSALPNKLFEYLAAGLPVLGANLLSLREFIEREKVGLVYDNAADLCKRLKEFDLREIKGRSYTMDNEIKHLEALYAKLSKSGMAKSLGLQAGMPRQCA
jgi:glycosyltransferase involved in cell wall biosynthesis